MRKKGMSLLAVFMAFTLAFQPVYAAKTREEIQRERQEAQRQQQSSQSQYDEAQGRLDDLEGEQEALEGEIQALDEELVEILASIGLMEEQIADTEEKIQQAQTEYDAAKAQEDAQYQDMKKRIRYLYEKGEAGYMEVLVQAAGVNDMLNQASYVEKLYEYDAKMLNRYIALKEEVAAKKNTLEDTKSELEAQKFEYEEEESALEVLLEEKKAVSEDYDTQIAKVKQEAAAYKAQIKQQNAKLQKLQEEENAIIKAEEERRKAQNANNSSNSSSKGSSVSTGSGGAKTVPPIIGTGTGSDIAQYACLFVGNPYVAGGTSLTNGADCSGFTQSVYRQYGYSIPRNSTSQRSAGREVSYADAHPGDLICYAGHVAIYLGGGRIVHASSPRTGIKYGYATYRPILSVRRIVN